MKTDGGWVSISEAARLYGKSRKWVSNQISTYDIETQKSQKVAPGVSRLCNQTHLIDVL